jgi:hypothetical protein
LTRESKEQNTERRGGGVGFLVKDQLDHEVIGTERYESFEVMELLIHTKSRNIRLINIYRPQRLSNKEASWETFKGEFSSLLSHHTSSSGSLMIVGDMNIHVNRTEDPQVKMYKRMLHENNLVQWVSLATHVGGGTLDHICTREEEDAILQPLQVHAAENPGAVSDHALLIFEVHSRKKPESKKKITYRRWDALNKQEFGERLSRGLGDIPLAESERMLECVMKVCKDLLDDMVPIKTKQVTAKSVPPWYSHDIHLARAERRRLERIWRRTKREEDMNRFKEQAKLVKKKLYETKEAFFQRRVQESAGNQKEMYNLINTLLGRKKENSPKQVRIRIWLRILLTSLHRK